MNKERIENHIKTIERWLDRFDKNTHINGRNKTIRVTAGREIELVLLQAENYFERNEDIRSALLHHHGDNPFAYEESLTYRWFDRDMPRLLTKLRELLRDLEEGDGGQNVGNGGD